MIAPFDMRVRNVARTFGVSMKQARDRINNRAAKRMTFIKKSFQADVDDPLHYDFINNTGRTGIHQAIEAISD